MTQITSKPDYGVPLVEEQSAAATFTLQNYLDDISLFLNGFLLGLQVVPAVYTFAELPKVDGDMEEPPVLEFPTVAGLIIVTGTDRNSGGPIPAYSDGTSKWLYFSDDTEVMVAPP